MESCAAVANRRCWGANSSPGPINKRPAALDPIGRGDAHEYRQLTRPHGANGGDGLEQKANSVFEASAILVFPIVTERREKLVDQIAVCGVELPS